MFPDHTFQRCTKECFLFKARRAQQQLLVSLLLVQYAFLLPPFSSLCLSLTLSLSLCVSLSLSLSLLFFLSLCLSVSLSLCLALSLSLFACIEVRSRLRQLCSKSRNIGPKQLPVLFFFWGGGPYYSYSIMGPKSLF